MWCWHGYQAGARCRLFAYGLADATAVPKHHVVSFLIKIQNGFFFLVLAYPGCSGKEACEVTTYDLANLFIVFRLHHMHGAQRCGLLPMFCALCVHIGQSVGPVSCAEMAEPIKMPFSV